MAKRRNSSRPTIRDIAQAAGVSLSTVSRALSGHAAISAETRARITEVAARVNYAGVAVQRGAAPPLPRAGSLVGVVIAAMHNSFYTELLDHLHTEFRTLGYHVTLIVDPLLDGGDISAFEPLIDGYLSGIVLTTATVRSPIAAELARRRMPTVLAVRSIDGAAVDTVEVDNVRAGEDAARHLFDLGHRRIGFILGPRNTSTARDRHAGALRFLHRQGVRVPGEWCAWGAYTHESGYSGAVQMLALTERPSALIAGNDTVALGVLDAARKSGLAIPADLSLIGFDDIPIAGWSFVGLTTIRQPTAEMARLAARRLAARIKWPDGPIHRDILPTNLVQRDTTAAVSR